MKSNGNALTSEKILKIRPLDMQPASIGHENGGPAVAERSFNALLGGLHVGLLLVDGEGRITAANQALGRLIEVDPQRWLHRSYREFFGDVLSKVSEAEIVQKDFEQALLNLDRHPVVQFSMQVNRPCYLRIDFFPLAQDQGAPSGWGALVQDETEIQTRVNRKLEMISTLAHDIRAPLATLKGHSVSLLENHKKWEGDLTEQFLQVVDRNVERLVEQIDRSLVLTRAEHGELGLQPDSIEVRILFERVLERASAILEQHDLRIDVAPVNLMVEADPRRIDEVVINLLENAVRYTPAGKTIVLRAEMDRVMAHLSVIDQGSGIAQDQQARIFDKFAHDKDSSRGGGLGLYICRKMIEAHGGQIWVESPPAGARRGTCFTFTLPLSGQWSERSMPQKHAEQRLSSWDGKEPARVLIVEDETDFQVLLCAVLNKAGFQAEVTRSGSAAIDIVSTSAPDLVILDWRLPDINGLQVCDEIRRWSEVPILMVTSMPGSDHLVKALHTGVNDYITKPFAMQELVARCQALLKRQRKNDSATRDQFSAEGFLINFDTYEVWMRGEPIELTPTEYKLLACLARNPKRVLTYDRLLDLVYGEQRTGSRHDLFVHISRLRNKLEPDAQEPRFIVTKWGVGYVFLP